jgi:hypothetical protein
MTDRVVLLEEVTYQRTERPHGFRIWSDGTVERTSDANPLPTLTERLDVDRTVQWEADRTLSAEQLAALSETIRQSGIFDVEPKMLINYCKEDPPAAIWKINLDGQSHKILVYDPRPRRSAVLDAVLAAVKGVLA